MGSLFIATMWSLWLIKNGVVLDNSEVQWQDIVEFGEINKCRYNFLYNIGNVRCLKIKKQSEWVTQDYRLKCLQTKQSRG